MKLRLPGILLSAVLACTCAAAAVVENPADGGVTIVGNNYYMSQAVTITQKDYDKYAAPATVLNVGTLYGEGALRVENAATLNVGDSLHIAGWGWDVDSSLGAPNNGSVYVGAGSTLNVNKQLNIGAGGPVNGTLEVNGGTVVTNYALNVGLGKGATGNLIISNGGKVIVRSDGTSASYLTVGYYEGSKGNVLIDGEGSSLTTEGWVEVFFGIEDADAVVTVRNGALLDLSGDGGSATYLGYTEDGAAQIVVEDATLVTGSVYVGDTGAGAITASKGAEVTVKGNLEVSGTYTGGGSGLVQIDGADTKLTVEGDTYVGYTPDSTGAVTVTNGAELAVNGVLQMGVLDGSVGSVKVDDGAKLTVTGSNAAGTEAVVLGTGATMTVGTGSTVESKGDITFEDGSSLVFEVEDADAAPSVNATGSTVDFQDGSKVVYVLDKTLANSETGEFTLPSITGDMTDHQPETEVYGPDGEKMDGAGTQVERLPDGSFGLQIKIEQEAANTVLAPDAQRMANTLWSSTGVVQDYGEAILAHFGRPGCKNVWGMGLGTFQRVSSTGDAIGYHYNGGGYAVGADTCVTERLKAGVSVGQMFGRHKATDGLSNVRQNSMMASLYGRYDLGCNKCGTQIMLDGYLGYGHTRNRARCYSDVNEQMVTGRWGDDVLAFGVKGTWQSKLTERSTIASFIGLRYLYGAQGDFTMASANSSRHYYDGSMHNMSIPMGVTLRYYYAVGSKGVISPSLTLGYIADVYRQNPTLRTRVLGNSTKFEGCDPGRHAFMLRAGVGYQMDEHWYMGAGYNLEARRDDVEHAVDVNVSYSF